MKDVVIIGGGIIGCSIAYELSHYEGSVVLVEKNSDIADEVSMANSAIVHAGYDPEDGTLKAKLNVRGAQLMKQWCAELEEEYQTCGAFVAACGEGEELLLHRLYERALRRNVKVQLLDKEAAIKLEPNLSDQVTMVMNVPDTAVITPWNFALSALETAVVNGCQVYLNSPVTAIQKLSKGYAVQAGKRRIEARYVINAAGLYSDQIDQIATGIKHFTIQARKGEYFVLAKDARNFISRVIYPVPGPKGKGVLAVPTVHGNILIGPNRNDTDREDHATDAEGLAMVRSQITHTMKNVPMQETIRTFSGLRPAGNHGDFYIREEVESAGFINVGCIDSPGIASAPAIGEYVRQLIEKKHPLKRKTHYKKCKPLVRMADLSMTDKQAMIQQDPRYGHIVCRCEKISEGEIIAAIQRPIPAKTIKAIKKRIRPGMGRCQGGFCEPLVTDILSKTMNVDMCDICYDQPETTMFVGHTKEEQL